VNTVENSRLSLQVFKVVVLPAMLSCLMGIEMGIEMDQETDIEMDQEMDRGTDRGILEIDPQQRDFRPRSRMTRTLGGQGLVPDHKHNRVLRIINTKMEGKSTALEIGAAVIAAMEKRIKITTDQRGNRKQNRDHTIPKVLEILTISNLMNNNCE